ncbi:hypothetical protein MHU86_10096 [Fragilaria crotonensis]|nr:hypothetical protein MHU86_10096 [Fragilaria crotonensis]
MILQPAMLVVELLWQVFMDARACFMHPASRTNASKVLQAGIDESFGGAMQHTEGMIIELPGSPLINGGVATSSIVLDDLSWSGGLMAGLTISTLSASQGHLAALSIRSASGQAHTNQAPVPEIIAIMWPFCKQKPGVGMCELLMGAEKQALSKWLVLGPRGTCIDFVYLGSPPMLCAPTTSVFKWEGLQCPLHFW